MEELVGKTLGRYQLTSLLGEGGMGAVFRAQDTVLGREVAIKVMSPQMAIQPDFRERFLQEARTAARLKHPNIVQVYDFAQEGDILYIVMELIPGKNLGQYFEELRSRGEWVSLPEAVGMVRQLALALDHAHKQGILHRDIKPGNILLTPIEGESLRFRPILTDLGLAKLAEGGVVTQVGMSLGTPAYMSPEQALGQTVDGRSDLYSLGVLLFQLSTRQLPFPAKTIMDAILYHAKQPAPAPRSIRPEIPAALESLILKAMEKEPAKRFVDGAEMAKALEEAQSQISIPQPVKVPAGIPARTPSKPDGLRTQMESNLVDERGNSILQEFSPPVSAKDRIQVLTQGKTGFSVPLKEGQIIIGRTSGADLVLNDEKVSRQHARIEFNGNEVRVVDMNSTNGTFMDNARLLAGVPEPWLPGKVLHIGDSYLHLERGGAATASPQATFISSTPAQQKAAQPASQGRIAISVAQPRLSVNPGQPAQLVILLVNQGAIVDHLKTSVEGVPATWIPVPPTPLQLMPGDQRELSITIQPPRSPQSRAGTYPLKILVTTREAGGDNQVEVQLEVTPFTQFSSELSPQKIRAGKAGRVKVQNQGNSREVYQLLWQDRAIELDFKPPNATIQVPEGQTAYAEFRASPRQRKLIGGDQTHPITVQVTAATGGAQTHNGEVVSRALIPIWVPPLLILLCLLLMAAAALTIPPMILNPPKTQAAIAASQTAAAATQLALADSDGDGLSNVEEINLGLNPNLADTDADGLPDGVEVKQYGTNPKDIDTDRDTIPDGAEVNGGCTSPNNPDSDGDGLPDNVDPQPCLLPSPTPTVTITPVPTPTLTPTPKPYFPCPGLAASRLKVGDVAFVSKDPPLANRVRKDHDTEAEILGYIQPGEEMDILEGPFCGEWIWWKVRALKTGMIGWTAEGDNKTYWLVPKSNN